MSDLVVRLLRGEPRAAARLITMIENGEAGPLLAEIFPHTGRAMVVGVTGPPGAGKSTLVNGMVQCWRAHGRTVGVLAVDPSSPFTGGAILGDRIRMTGVSGDPGVYIRSMASRAKLGGLAEAAPAAIRVLDAMGLDVIVVETVGVGQSEVAIADTADCTVVVTMPGGGDGIQAMKAGVLEIGDLFVVNKADREGALRTQRELNAALRLQEREHRPPVLLTRADAGEGVPEAVSMVDDFLAAQRESGRLEEQRLLHLKRETLELIGAQARRRTVAALDDAVMAEFAEALRCRRRDPAAIAASALTVLTEG